MTEMVIFPDEAFPQGSDGHQDVPTKPWRKWERTSKVLSQVSEVLSNNFYSNYYHSRYGLSQSWGLKHIFLWGLQGGRKMHISQR
ncbi:hypothetical protein RJ55_07518 [Drechmeria coniospora]|nr:hypothetical protein RJ55_07518 [Drechmeria coniospora]